LEEGAFLFMRETRETIEKQVFHDIMIIQQFIYYFWRGLYHGKKTVQSRIEETAGSYDQLHLYQ
jgi:hypothetical protein